MKDTAELDEIIGYTQGTRGDDFPDDMVAEDWKYIYEAIDVCDMCGHWEDRCEFDERTYCGRCQADCEEEEDAEWEDVAVAYSGPDTPWKLR